MECSPLRGKSVTGEPMSLGVIALHVVNKINVNIMVLGLGFRVSVRVNVFQRSVWE